MSLFGGARTVGLVVMVVASVIQAVDARFIARLRKGGAGDADSAVDIGESRGLLRWRVARLQRKGLIRCVAGRRYYFDEACHAAYRRRKLIWIAVLGPLVVAAGIAAFLFR